MQRAQARAALARRAGIALMLMVGLGAAAFAIGRIVRNGALRTQPTASTVAQIKPPPTAVASTSATAAVPSASASAIAALRPIVPIATQPVKPVDRLVGLDLLPPMGDRVSIDGEPQVAVVSGQTLTLDSKAHVLVFDCTVCDSVEKDVPAGSENVNLSVRIPIKKATLIISGDPNKTYKILGHEDYSVHAGTNLIPMTGARESVTVQQVETNVPQQIYVQAGHSVTVTF
jgi:hypothetical protein